MKSHHLFHWVLLFPKSRKSLLREKLPVFTLFILHCFFRGNLMFEIFRIINRWNGCHHFLFQIIHQLKLVVILIFLRIPVSTVYKQWLFIWKLPNVTIFPGLFGMLIWIWTISMRKIVTLNLLQILKATIAIVAFGKWSCFLEFHFYLFLCTLCFRAFVVILLLFHLIFWILPLFQRGRFRGSLCFEFIW